MNDALLIGLALTLLGACAATGILYAYSRKLRFALARMSSRRRALSTYIRQLRKARAKATIDYFAALRNNTAATLVTTPAGEIIGVSNALVALLGYASEEELRRLHATQLYANPADRQSRFTNVLMECGSISSSEFRLRRRDGTLIDTLISARLVQSPDGTTLYEGVVTDITRLREAEEQQRQLLAQLHLARKLEVIGQLASGIAHEINTPIQFIGDNAHFLKSAFDRLSGLVGSPRPPPGTAGKPVDLELMRADVAGAFAGTFEGIERVTEIVRAMKEFAHPGDTEKSATDLNQAIQTTLTVARNEYKHAADVVVELAPIPLVDCRRGEINKVLLNLIVNAAHAIESASKRSQRGTITIRTESDAKHVRISIADTGCGIPPAIIKRIFDPFFTTKPVGKGTGQGLAIARSIVHDHDGVLTVSSTVGVGTTFVIELPLSDSAPQLPHNPAPGAELESAIG